MTDPSHSEFSDRSLDALLRAARQDIPDDGFSERVTRALPPRPLIQEACSKRATILLAAFVALCLLFRWIGVPEDLPLRPEAWALSVDQHMQGRTKNDASHSSSNFSFAPQSLRWQSHTQNDAAHSFSDFSLALHTLKPSDSMLVEVAAVAMALAGIGTILYSLIEER
jgi:Domain of unknown function (DUF5056)